MIHDRFCQLGTDKDAISPDECSSCDWVQRIRDDERSHMGIIGLAFNAGVQAARDAVKNTPCPEGYEAKGCSHWDDALAAIDALTPTPQRQDRAWDTFPAQEGEQV